LKSSFNYSPNEQATFASLPRLLLLLLEPPPLLPQSNALKR
jgi:hypothetical protein